MRDGNAIEVRNVYKSFKVYLDRGRTLKELTLFKERRKFENRAVLNDISFEVKKGEAIGLVGKNGCGKSTTLKLLTRIMYPDSGSIEMKGRVSSLIELGAGFHPDMSGLQNIYTNAAIFGLTRKEIDARLADIIAFSELEEFIDNPVRTYSSGMYMRLAFAVAINVDADILLIDEILAVGDAKYQEKCFNKLLDIKENGATIVIVSHSLDQIEKICDRSIWIDQGVIREEGTPEDVHDKYLEYMGVKRTRVDPEKLEKERIEREKREAEERAAELEAARQRELERQIEFQNALDAAKAQGRAEAEEEERRRREQEEEERARQNRPMGTEGQERWGSRKAAFTGIRIIGGDQKEKTTFTTGEHVQIQLSYDVYKPVKNAVVGIAIFRADEFHVYGTNTWLDKLDQFDLTQSGKIEIDIPHLDLIPGEYTLDFAIEEGMGNAVDYYTRAASILVCSDIGDVGLYRPEHYWHMNIE